MLAMKRRKNGQRSVMPKYWVKNYFTQGRFPEVGQKQKTEKKKKKKRKKDRK